MTASRKRVLGAAAPPLQKKSEEQHRSSSNMNLHTVSQTWKLAFSQSLSLPPTAFCNSWAYTQPLVFAASFTRFFRVYGAHLSVRFDSRHLPPSSAELRGEVETGWKGRCCGGDIWRIEQSHKKLRPQIHLYILGLKALVLEFIGWDIHIWHLSYLSIWSGNLNQF